MPQGTIHLRRPVARLDDRVLVLNYRRRPPIWEPGVCTGVQWREWWRRGEVHLSYMVRLDRLAPSGHPIHLETLSVRVVRS